jgi:uncharacterized protein
MLIGVEVVYALPDHAIAQHYRLAEGISVGELLIKVRADPKFAGIEWGGTAVGVYGQQVSGEQRLRDGDRLEIYRPLQEDPKSARRRRAKKSYGS